MVHFLQEFVNWLSGPKISFFLTILLLFMAFRYVRVWTKPRFSKFLGLGILVIFGLFLLNAHFRHLVSLPDNVPIVAMLFLVAFFTWLSLSRGAENDMRKEAGQPTLEEEDNGSEKVFVWPNLVFVEFIASIVGSIVLIAWSILLKAPLEEPANVSNTPNPSKAPWYFLGLQEMLVYYDPWLAGVVFPTLIIVGLLAIPYIDRNPKGNGYFTVKERSFSIMTFFFGFHVLWVFMIIGGTFLRGPGWNFFGPFEVWNPHKVVPLLNVNLSDIIYVKMLGMALPKSWLVREIWGLLLIGGYFSMLPVIFTKLPAVQLPWFGKLDISGFFKKLRVSCGSVRYYLTVFLILCLMSLPIKMVLRWFFNLKYIVTIPEFFFNI